MTEKYLSPYTGEDIDQTVEGVKKVESDLVQEILDRQAADAILEQKIPTQTSQLENNSNFINSVSAAPPVVNTLPENSSATATVVAEQTGNTAEFRFTFGIPRGVEGRKGDTGDTGVSIVSVELVEVV